MYSYQFFGVGFKSEFKIYNVPCKEAGEEVLIKKIENGFNEDEMREAHINFKNLPDGVWFMNACGQFFVRGGRLIEVFAKPTASDYDVSCFIIGWCIAFLFEQRGFLPIHCTALVKGDNAFLVSGVSGAGKSTTAMELIRSGCQYLSDDIAMVSVENGLMIYPGFPMQKMCRDVAEGYNGSELLYIDEEKDKFATINIDDFCDKPIKLKALFLLEKEDIGSVLINKITGIDKLFALINSLFLLEIYDRLGIPEKIKFSCLKVAGSIDIYRIKRPMNADTKEEICKHIMEIQ